MTTIELLHFDYGVTALTAPVEAIFWAAGKSSADPRAKLAAINAERAQAGIPLAYVPCGHPALR